LDFENMPSTQFLFMQKVLNCKLGAKVLISKVGSNVRAQERSADGRFRELLTDFRGQNVSVSSFRSAGRTVLASRSWQLQKQDWSRTIAAYGKGSDRF